MTTKEDVAPIFKSKELLIIEYYETENDDEESKQIIITEDYLLDRIYGDYGRLLDCHISKGKDL